MEIWEEPVRGGYPPPWSRGLTGDDRYERFLEISLRPPISHLTGLTPVGWLDDEVTAVMPASPWLASPQGRIPLGALAVVADLAFGMGLGSRLPPGSNFTTAELSLTRVREPEFGGDLVAKGRLVHATLSIGLTEAKVYDGGGHLVAAGTSRLAVFPPAEDPPELPDPMPKVEHPIYETPDPWARPVLGEVLDSSTWRDRSGRDVLEAQVRGEIPPPPLGRLTGLAVADADDGTATVTLPASEWLCTPAGTAQGGFTAMIADAALACAVQTVVERGDSFVPIDIKVNYLRPVVPDGKLLRAVGTVTHKGRSLAIAHATVVNGDGKPVAFATGSAALAARLG